MSFTLHQIRYCLCNRVPVTRRVAVQLSFPLSFDAAIVYCPPSDSWASLIVSEYSPPSADEIENFPPSESVFPSFDLRRNDGNNHGYCLVQLELHSGTGCSHETF